MRGIHAALAALLASLALAACGEDERFSDSKIADAIGAEDDQVDGDPFCVIDDYLNDTEQIDAERKSAPVITSARGGVGVVVEPPFPSDCEQKVRKGLNKLDPKEKE
jgi:hypothetical protein